MGLSKLASRCRVCQNVDTCDHKRMEACGYLPLAGASSMPTASSVAQPVLRETVEIRVNGQQQRVYKDEIEKQLTKGLYANLGLQYGA